MSLIPKTLIAGLVLSSSTAFADWELNNDDSAFFYLTSKAASITETNSFTNLSGRIDNDGDAVLEIDLSSVDTAIEIRDERVRDMLFETGDYPTAVITIDVDSFALGNMALGSYHVATYDYNLTLHGISMDLSAVLKVTKIDDGRLEIQSYQPVIISASQFGLSQGVEALREIAGLPSINPNVVVDFSLIYDEL